VLTLESRFTAKVSLGAILCLGLAGLARGGSIAPCPTGTLAGVDGGTPCSIGDKQFTFSNFQSQGGFSDTAVMFTPDAASDGFTLTDVLSAGCQFCTEQLDVQVDVAISTLSGQPTISGLSATTDGGGIGLVKVFAKFNECGSSNDCVFADPGLANSFNFDQGNFKTNYSSVSGSPSVPNSGLAAYGIQINGGGNAFIQSASFSVDQVTTVPEPASLLLVASGLVAAAATRLRRQFRQRRFAVNGLESALHVT
jgi:PEP-CTERM motif-containing protein